MDRTLYENREGKTTVRGPVALVSMLMAIPLLVPVFTLAIMIRVGTFAIVSIARLGTKLGRRFTTTTAEGD